MKFFQGDRCNATLGERRYIHLTTETYQVISKSGQSNEDDMRLAENCLNSCLAFCGDFYKYIIPFFKENS